MKDWKNRLDEEVDEYKEYGDPDFALLSMKVYKRNLKRVEQQAKREVLDMIEKILPYLCRADEVDIKTNLNYVTSAESLRQRAREIEKQNAIVSVFRGYVDKELSKIKDKQDEENKS